jgi:hypothetical protein
MIIAFAAIAHPTPKSATCFIPAPLKLADPSRNNTALAISQSSPDKRMR